MKWYHYLGAFFSGMFLANFVPHFVNGVSGNPFPTPFSNPPGKGLSSPLTNVLWALLNFFVGYTLFRGSQTNPKNRSAMVVFFAGVITISVMLSIAFVDKAKM